MDFDKPSLQALALVVYLVGQFIFLVNGFMGKNDTPRKMLFKSFVWIVFFLKALCKALWFILVKPFVDDEWHKEETKGASQLRDALNHGLPEVKSECPMPKVKPPRLESQNRPYR
jgi:hypothetical protein